MLFENIKALCEIPGVSGCEEQVRYEILKLIEGKCIYKVDTLGNILAFKKGAKPRGKTLLLSAHMDEVGLIITSADESGLLRFDTVGGIDRRTLPGKPVDIGGVRGVVGAQPVHLKTAVEKDTSAKIDNLFIDIGAETAVEALAAVSLGDRAVFVSEFSALGDGFVRARALDNRIGCALLIELIESELTFDTHFAFTVQEESGTVGGRTAAAQLAPENAIIVETTTACDIPGVPPEKTVCSLKSGPVLSFMDRGTVYDMPLYRRSLALAQEHKIPCQSKAGVYGGNESRSVQAAGNGARVVAVSVPCRYLHTPSCVAAKGDIEATLALLSVLVEKLDSEETR